MENPYLAERPSPRWPFTPSDEITESSCSNLITKNGKRLSVILKIARHDGIGPPFEEERQGDREQLKRLYKWSDVLTWLGPDSGLYYDPDYTIRRYATEDPNIAGMRNAYSKERSRRIELENELRIATRPASAPGLLDEQTIVSIAREFPVICGVYFLVDDNEIVYVGKSANVYKRACQHLTEKTWTKIAVLPIPQDRLDEVEQAYINHFAPRLNKTL